MSDAELLAELLDALCTALPYVEDAETDPALKKGAAKRHARQIRQLIGKAESAEHRRNAAPKAPKRRHDPIPKDHPVQPLKPKQEANDRATCGYCGLSWDDSIPTAWTPAPSARCPFEPFHRY